MSVKAFYDEIGGNYSDALQRLMNDALIYKFIMKFPEDENFAILKTALENKDIETAFSAAHTLKGVSLNLSFDKLSAAAVIITDALRPENRDNYSFCDFERMFAKVEKEYTAVSGALKKLTL